MARRARQRRLDLAQPAARVLHHRLLARHQIAIARFGTDVAAADGIGPALAAGLDPAGYPVVPGGVPQAWERAQVYLGALRAVPGAVPGAGGRIAPPDGKPSLWGKYYCRLI